MKEYVRTLKEERDYLLEQGYVTRIQEHKLSEYLESDLIKVITGPRRAGKSTLALKCMSKYNDFFYINFDNLEVLKIEDKFQFILECSTEFENGKRLFLDEIQNVDKFELLVNQLQRNGFNIVMTGSNANLLSRELATHLTGRYLRIEVLPFSYNEAKLINADLTYLEYIKIGGFPEPLKSGGKTVEYLQTLFESILLKDIVARYSLRNSADLLKLSNYFVKTPSQTASYSKLANKLGISSVNTVMDYYSYLMEAYLLFKLNTYSFKASEIVKSDFKTYLIDTGVFAAHSSKFDGNLGYLFENAVFLELLRGGYTPGKNLYKYKNKDGSEIDFLIVGEKFIRIQACLSLLENSTRNREFGSLRGDSSDVESKNLVVVLDSTESRFSEEGVDVIGIENLATWLEDNRNV